MSNFAEKLKYLRTKHELNQKDLAFFLKISQSSIHNWETGKRQPSIEAIQQIAHFFSVPVSYLTGNEPIRSILALFSEIPGNPIKESTDASLPTDDDYYPDFFSDEIIDEQSYISCTDELSKPYKKDPSSAHNVTHKIEGQNVLDFLGITESDIVEEVAKIKTTPKPTTLAAYYVNEEFSAEEIAEICNYIEYVKSKRK